MGQCNADRAVFRAADRSSFDFHGTPAGRAVLVARPPRFVYPQGMPLRRRSLVPLLLSALAAGLTAAAIPAATVRPNVVFILTDDQDLVLNSMSYMPQTRALLAQQGMTFTQDFVPLSLCCPSRSTILTGLYPHNHKVYTNVAPDGGFAKFAALGHEEATVATALHAVGYRTALFGKYLNGYPDGADALVQRGRRERQAGEDPAPAAPLQPEHRGHRPALPPAAANAPIRGRGRGRHRPHPGGRGPARQHLRLLHLRQRLPHGPAPPPAGQVHAVRAGRARAAPRARPRRPGRQLQRRADGERRLRAHDRRAGRGAAAGRARRPLPGAAVQRPGAGGLAPGRPPGAVRLQPAGPSAP